MFMGELTQTAREQPGHENAPRLYARSSQTSFLPAIGRHSRSVLIVLRCIFLDALERRIDQTAHDLTLAFPSEDLFARLARRYRVDFKPGLKRRSDRGLLVETGRTGYHRRTGKRAAQGRIDASCIRPVSSELAPLGIYIHSRQMISNRSACLEHRCSQGIRSWGRDSKWTPSSR